MSTVLDVAIGLAFVFFLVSLLASAAQETLANLTNSRGKMLELAVAQLLNGTAPKAGGVWGFLRNQYRISSKVMETDQKDTLAGQVLGHGLLDALFRGDRLPSYIPAEKFTDALIDCLRRRAGENAPTAEGLLWAIRRLPPTKSMHALETIVMSSSNDITQLRAQLIDWYNASMDRVTGWYTRAVKYRTFVIGFLLAAAFQIDAIRITQDLAQNSVLRASVVAVATAQTSGAAPATTPAFQETVNKLNDLALPIGWCSSSDPKCTLKKDAKSRALRFVGWIVVALAVSQGAPFWFDLINRLVAIRGVGPKPSDAGSAQSASTTPVVAQPAVAAQPAPPAPWTAAVNATAPIPIGMTEDDLRNVQNRLIVPITGALDAATRDAIRTFQARMGRALDGNLTVDLAREILSR